VHGAVMFGPGATVHVAPSADTPTPLGRLGNRHPVRIIPVSGGRRVGAHPTFAGSRTG
jgi:hypothetical protein